MRNQIFQSGVQFTLISAAIFVIHISAATGQITLQRNNLPLPGDHTRRVVCFPVSEGPSGANVVWDFSNLQVSINALPLNYYYSVPTALCNNDDLLGVFSAFGSGGESQMYQTTPQTYDLTYEYDWYSSVYYHSKCYNVPRKKSKFPFTYQDSVISTFEFESAYWDGNITIINSSGSGYDSTVCDGWGTVILPNGTFDALRTRSVVYMFDSLTFNTNFPTRYDTIYQFYTLIYKEPIVTVRYYSTFNYSTGQWSNVTQHVLWCDSSTFVTQVPQAEITQPEVTLLPGPAMNEFILEFDRCEAGTYSIEVVGLDGRISNRILLENYSVKQRHSINLQHLTPGIYLIGIRSGNSRFRALKAVIR